MLFADFGFQVLQNLRQTHHNIQLEEDEKVCSEKIVNDLWRNSLRFELSQEGHVKKLGKTYAIIFRQTESWKVVQNMFQFALSKANTSDQCARLCISYLHKINQLRMNDIKLHDSLTSLERISNILYEEENKKIKDTPGGEIVKLKVAKVVLENEINNFKLTIKYILSSIFSDLKNSKRQLRICTVQKKMHFSCTLSILL